MLGHKKMMQTKLENLFLRGFDDMDLSVKALVGQITAMFLVLLLICFSQRAPLPGFRDGSFSLCSLVLSQLSLYGCLGTTPDYCRSA
ncbi:Uncharacterised protein [uncultured archaeon]|nr:Uncharacterised protein [uncultured archaeon]